MIPKLTGRSRARALLFACILLLGMLPLATATASNHRTSTKTDISFTSTPLEVLEPGEEWVDEAGIFHLRGEVSLEEIAGDINGLGTITFNGDFVPGPSCVPDDPDNCFEGEFSGWGTAVIEDENGTWDGNFLIYFAFFEGEEPFMFGKAILAGRGGNAGKSIVADIFFGDEEDDTAYFEGFMLTMAVPSFGVNMHTQLCGIDDEFTLHGAFVSTGAIESSGAASGEFFAGGHWWTHTYGLFGEITITDDHGSLMIQFLGMAQDNWQTSVGWGHWVIVEGTGAYANVNGHGKVSGNAGEFMQCSSGWGVWLQFIGQMHFN